MQSQFAVECMNDERDDDLCGEPSRARLSKTQNKKWLTMTMTRVGWPETVPLSEEQLARGRHENHLKRLHYLAQRHEIEKAIAFLLEDSPDVWKGDAGFQSYLNCIKIVKKRGSRTQVRLFEEAIHPFLDTDVERRYLDGHPKGFFRKLFV